MTEKDAQQQIKENATIASINWTKTIEVSSVWKREGREIPFEELHEQTDVEDASQDEEETVPQTDAGVESREVQVVVVTDSSDHCRHTNTHPQRNEQRS